MCVAEAAEPKGQFLTKDFRLAALSFGPGKILLFVLLGRLCTYAVLIETSFSIYLFVTNSLIKWLCSSSLCSLCSNEINIIG